MRLDPFQELGIQPGASPDQARAAYLRRASETDPARTAGLDPRIQEAARRARARVEAAYAWIRDPSGPWPEVGDSLPSGPPGSGSGGDPPAPGAEPKSYFKAVSRTLLLPGLGSVYAGSPLRGLVVFCLFASGVAASLSSRLATSRAMAAGDLMGRLGLVKEVAIDVYWLIGLAIADALLATWAANDRLKSR